MYYANIKNDQSIVDVKFPADINKHIIIENSYVSYLYVFSINE